MRRRGYTRVRRYRRLTVRVEVEYDAGDGTRRELASTLGAGGLFVASEAPLPKGWLLEVRFALPGVETPFAMQGRVAWADATGMGIEFLERAAIVRLAQVLDAWRPLDPERAPA